MNNLIMMIVGSIFHTLRYRRHREITREFEYMIQHQPYEALKLVQQAHKHESFVTDPHIFVGADMREKLAYPLTVAQAQIIGATQYPVTENNFEYEVVQSSFDEDIIINVLITIDYKDTAKGIDLHFHKVPMYVKCAYNKERLGMEVVCVEHELHLPDPADDGLYKKLHRFTTAHPVFDALSYIALLCLPMLMIIDRIPYSALIIVCGPILIWGLIKECRTVPKYNVRKPVKLMFYIAYIAIALLAAACLLIILLLII